MDPVALLPAWLFFSVNLLTPGPNVLNTIGTAFGSGRQAAYGCAAACGVGVLMWSAAALLGAGALFLVFPDLHKALTALGATVLLYFAYRYIRRALTPAEGVARISGVSPRRAFAQALAVLATNPKAMTTWLALLTLFPAISANGLSMLTFALGSALMAAGGHAVYATVFSTARASRIYERAVRPVNGIVGIGFTFYAIKLLVDLV